MEALKNKIKVVLADDHEIFRDGLRNLLTKNESFEVCGEAATGEELVKLAGHISPDVILTDIKMPEMDGIEATRILHQKFPKMGIVALSMHGEDHFIKDMLEAGANGYLLKNSGKDEITEAIYSVFEGTPYYCKSTTHQLTRLIASSQYNPYKQRQQIGLNEREKEIISLIAEGFTTREIAQKVFLSSRTIEGLRLKIMEKLQVKNIAGLIIYAVKKGILSTKGE